MNTQNINQENLSRQPKPQRQKKAKRQKASPYRYLLILAVVTIIAVVSIIAAVSANIKYRRQQKAYVEAGISNPAFSMDVANKMAQAAEAQGRQAVLDNMRENFSNGTSRLSFLK